MLRNIEFVETQLALQRIEVGRKVEGVGQNDAAFRRRPIETRQQLMDIDCYRSRRNDLAWPGADEGCQPRAQSLGIVEPGPLSMGPAVYRVGLPLIEGFEQNPLGSLRCKAEGVAIQINRIL